jgi:hypothetical protein
VVQIAVGRVNCRIFAFSHRLGRILLEVLPPRPGGLRLHFAVEEVSAGDCVVVYFIFLFLFLFFCHTSSRAIRF